MCAQSRSSNGLQTIHQAHSKLPPPSPRLSSITIQWSYILLSHQHYPHPNPTIRIHRRRSEVTTSAATVSAFTGDSSQLNDIIFAAAGGQRKQLANRKAANEELCCCIHVNAQEKPWNCFMHCKSPHLPLATSYNNKHRQLLLISLLENIPPVNKVEQ